MAILSTVYDYIKSFISKLKGIKSTMVISGPIIIALLAIKYMEKLVSYLKRIYNLGKSYFIPPDEILCFGRLKPPIRGIEFQSDTRERISYHGHVLIVEDYDFYVENGIRYKFELLEWINPKPELIHSVNILFSDQDKAYAAAKDSGLGRQPLFHRAHTRWTRDHYHISKHYYVKCDRWHKDMICNLHFCFGSVRIL